MKERRLRRWAPALLALPVVLALLWAGRSRPAWGVPEAAVGEQALPFTASRFRPGGALGLSRLLNGEPLDRAAVAAEVARQGFFTGEPLGAADCAACHADIAAQWAQSAHRFASFNNPYYAAAVERVQHDRDPALARFCAGCHDPALLITDAIARRGLPRTTAAAQAGLPCLVCHSIHEATDVRGNGGYRLTLTPVPAPSPGAPLAMKQSAHSARLRPAALAKSEVCAHCHKVGLIPELTQDGWFRGQNDYDAWQSSVAGGQGVAAVYRDGIAPKRCQDCHMPLEPGSGGRLVRSHRFLAANTALPHLRGDADMEARTAAFLRGAVSLDLLVVPRAERSEAPPHTEAQVRVDGRGEVLLDVVLRNRRVGHRFPSGTQDSNEARVVIEVRRLDAGGAGLLLRDDHHVIRAQPVNAAAEPLRRRDVQHLRGVVYDTSLGPADPQVIRYRLPLAALTTDATSASTPRPAALEVRATLRYRKFSLAYAAFACEALPPGETRARCLAPPEVEMAAARRVLLLDEPPPQEGAKGASAAPVEVDESLARPRWERLLDHGLGLADGVVDQTSEAQPSLERAALLARDRAEPQLGLARLALAQGRTADVLAAVERALTLRPEHPAGLWLRAQALYRTYRWHEARPPLERLAVLLPRDRNVQAMLARVRGLTGDAAGALVAAEALLQIDAESEEGFYQRMLALRDLGRAAEAAVAEESYLRFRRKVEQEQQLRDRFRLKYPVLAAEDAPAHTHDLTPPR